MALSKHLWAAALLLVMACTPYTAEHAAGAAEQFVLQSSSYRSGGQRLDLVDQNTLQCDSCYIFVYRYSSLEGGVEHYMDVLVQENKVIQAILDNRWDELRGRDIEDDAVLDSLSAVPAYYCPAPRPEICTGNDDPVCGSDGVDYSNGCSACSQRPVKWYTRGICSLGYTQKVIDDLNRGRITDDSTPVIVMIGWELMG
ncbi:MAG: Kazal-type serine protease inhibitor family protein [archaeon]